MSEDTKIVTTQTGFVSKDFSGFSESFNGIITETVATTKLYAAFFFLKRKEINACFFSILQSII